MHMRELQWRCDDGIELPVTVHEPERPRAVLVVAAAMGVPRRYYSRFAADMAARDIATVTFDYRGIGEAAGGLPDPKGTSFQDWGRRDLHAVLRETYARYPQLPAFLVGHSAGAQIAGMTPLAERLKGFVFVAGPRPHLSEGRGLGWFFLLLWWYVIVPLGTRGRWFPARRLRFAAVDVPAGVAAEWGRWARSKRYLFSPEHGIDTSRYARFSQPVLAYSFSDDPYAPRLSAERLLSEYPNLKVTRRHLRPAEVGARAIGHVGYFREALKDSLWAETAQWIDAVVGALPQKS